MTCDTRKIDDYGQLQGQCYELWKLHNPTASRLTELWPGCCPLDLLYGCARLADRERVQSLVGKLIRSEP
jgi:hypothetical protein